MRFENHENEDGISYIAVRSGKKGTESYRETRLDAQTIENIIWAIELVAALLAALIAIIVGAVLLKIMLPLI